MNCTKTGTINPKGIQGLKYLTPSVSTVRRTPKEYVTRRSTTCFDADSETRISETERSCRDSQRRTFSWWSTFTGTSKIDVVPGVLPVSPLIFHQSTSLTGGRTSNKPEKRGRKGTYDSETEKWQGNSRKSLGTRHEDTWSRFTSGSYSQSTSWVFFDG